MLKEQGQKFYCYQSTVDELEYRDKKIRSELDRNNLEYHKNLLDLRSKIGLGGANTDRMQANYELMLRDKDTVISDLQE